MSFADLAGMMSEGGGGSVLTDQVVKFLETYEDDYAKDEFYHVSSLYYMCPRCELYQRVLPPEMFAGEALDAVTRAKFDIGHAMHYWYQNKYLGPMGVLKGTWECVRCDEKRNGFYPKLDSSKCHHGGKHRWEFVEAHVFSEEWEIKGKYDGLLDFGDGEEIVLDIKTSDPDWFKKMKKPWDSAVAQLQVYMWLLGVHKGVLLYVDKSANGPVPVKDFKVEFDPSAVEDAKGKISEIRLGLTSHTLPDCRCPKKTFRLTCGEVEKSKKAKTIIKSWMESKEG
jgi:hypothetical protein